MTDETEYLLSNAANAQRIMKSLDRFYQLEQERLHLEPMVTITQAEYDALTLAKKQLQDWREEKERRNGWQVCYGCGACSTCNNCDTWRKQ